MQLELFPSKLIENANKLIDALNIGRKHSELYYALELIKITDKIFISVVIDKNKFPMFNIINENGDVPEGCTACFRTWQHISNELKITIDDIDKFEVHSFGAIIKSANNTNTEGIIELAPFAKKKYQNFGCIEENWNDDMYYILDKKDNIIASFESIEDLRNHLK